MENVKLIDGLMAIDCFQGESTIQNNIIVICVWIFIIFTIFAIYHINENVCKLYVAIAIVAIIATLVVGFYPFKTDTYAKVAINDPSKCTYEDIVENYTITAQKGNIYTILLEDKR